MIFLLLLFFILIVNKTRKCSHKLLAFKHIVLERTILFFFLFSFFISLPTSQYSLCACDIFISFPSQKFHFHLMLLLCDARVAKKKRKKRKNFLFSCVRDFPIKFNSYLDSLCLFCSSYLLPLTHVFQLYLRICRCSQCYKRQFDSLFIELQEFSSSNAISLISI
jgi:hypothetical protein